MDRPVLVCFGPRGATYPRVRPEDDHPAALRPGNRVRVLETVAHRGRATRAEIARATGLASTTVSALVAELLTEDLLAERSAPRGPRGRGRPATLLTLARRAAVCSGCTCTLTASG
jgi:predicted ArsR family transcriptional regulator